MKRKIIIHSIITFVIAVLICGSIMYSKLKRTNEELVKQIDYYETLLNQKPAVEDSIIYNIIVLDSTIVKYKKDIVYEKEIIKELNVDESVAKFNELVWAD